MADRSPEEHVEEGPGQRKGGNQPEGGKHRVTLAERVTTRQANGARDLRAIIECVLGVTLQVTVLIFALDSLVAAVGVLAYIAWRQSVPGVQVTSARRPRSSDTRPRMTFGLQATRGNVADAEVRLLQGGKTTVMAKPRGNAGASGRDAGHRRADRDGCPRGRRHDRGVGA